MTEVLLLPNLGYNLISISSLTAKNCRTVFEGEVALVKLDENLIFTALLKNGIYFIKEGNENLVKEPTALPLYERNSLKGFHKKLGNISRSILDEIIKHDTLRDIIISSKTHFDCTACILGNISGTVLLGPEASQKRSWTYYILF